MTIDSQPAGGAMSEIDEVKEELREIARVIWRGDNGESVMARLQHLESTHRTLVRIAGGILLLVAPQALYMLWLGFKAVVQEP